jgi:hypothetical protein
MRLDLDADAPGAVTRGHRPSLTIGSGKDLALGKAMSVPGTCGTPDRPQGAMYMYLLQLGLRP